MQGACCKGVLAMLPVLRRQSSSRDRDAEMLAMTFLICMTAIVGETAARHVRRFRIVCPTTATIVRLQSPPCIDPSCTKGSQCGYRVFNFYPCCSAQRSHPYTLGAKKRHSGTLIGDDRNFP